MAESNLARIVVSKLDAARRQIETAVLLWFDDGDPVSTLSLTANGHRICHDIGKSRGQKSPVIFAMTNIPADKQKAYKKTLCLTENFFKHAEKDPDPRAGLVFFPEFTEIYLIEAIDLFKRISGHHTHLMMAFRWWYYHLVVAPERSKADESVNDPLTVKLKALPKREFFIEFLALLAQSGE